MAMIVDIQGFQLPDQFVLKEFANITLRSDTINHILLQSPIPWNDIPPNYQKINNWLTRNCHGLIWADGDVPYNSLFNEIRKILEPAEFICVKGLEKKRWIENIIKHSKPVIDLHDYGCPSIRNLRISIYEEHKCGNNMQHINCAAKNVLNLKHWFISMLLEVHCIGESSVFSQFFITQSRYINYYEELKAFHEDLRCFWENMELLKKDFGVETHEEVFSLHNNQSCLIHLSTQRPWITDLHQLVEKYFHKSTYAAFQPLINELYKLWDKNEKLKLRIKGQRENETKTSIKTEDKKNVEDEMQE